MKKYSIIFIGLISLLALYSFNTYNNRADELLKELGIPATDARSYIWRTFIGESFSFPSNSNIRNYPQDKRATAVQVIGAYVKDYLTSIDFVKQYQQFREERKPRSPLSVGDRVKTEIHNLNLLLKDAQDGFRKANPELKSIYEASIKKYKQSINAFENDYDPQHPAQMEGILTQYDYDMSDYRFRLKQFEREYPADVKLFIRNRLQDFLLLSSTVDFNAKLIQQSGAKKFANPSYEAKPNAWKYCFLAGKESTSAARRLAAQWIKEI